MNPPNDKSKDDGYWKLMLTNNPCYIWVDYDKTNKLVVEKKECNVNKVEDKKSLLYYYSLDKKSMVNYFEHFWLDRLKYKYTTRNHLTAISFYDDMYGVLDYYLNKDSLLIRSQNRWEKRGLEFMVNKLGI